jgi:hypothetical protein
LNRMQILLTACAFFNGLRGSPGERNRSGANIGL